MIPKQMKPSWWEAPVNDHVETQELSASKPTETDEICESITQDGDQELSKWWVAPAAGHVAPVEAVASDEHRWWHAPSVGAWLVQRIQCRTPHANAMDSRGLPEEPMDANILESAIEKVSPEVGREEAVYSVTEDPILKMDRLEAVQRVAENSVIKMNTLEAGQRVAEDPIAKMDRLELVQRVVEDQLDRLEEAVHTAAAVEQSSTRNEVPEQKIVQEVAAKKLATMASTKYSAVVCAKAAACKVPSKASQSRGSSPSPTRALPTREQVQCTASAHGRRSSTVVACGKVPERRPRTPQAFRASPTDEAVKDPPTIRPSVVRAHAPCESWQGVARATSPARRIETPSTLTGYPKSTVPVKGSISARNSNLSPTPRPTSPTPANSSRGKAAAPQPPPMVVKLSSAELELREAEACMRELKRLQEKNARCAEKMSRQGPNASCTQQRKRNLEEKEVQKEQRQASKEGTKEKMRFTQGSAVEGSQARSPLGEVQRAVIKPDSAKEKLTQPATKEVKFTHVSPVSPESFKVPSSSEDHSCNISDCERSDGRGPKSFDGISENDCSQLEKRQAGKRPAVVRKRRVSAPGGSSLSSSNSVVPPRIESVLGF